LLVKGVLRNTPLTAGTIALNVVRPRPQHCSLVTFSNGFEQLVRTPFDELVALINLVAEKSQRV
jgi:hypothetical protein